MMKEYLKIYSDFRAFVSYREAMTLVMSSLVRICESQNWKIHLSPIIKKAFANEDPFPTSEICLNFNKELKILSLTLNRKKGFNMMGNPGWMNSINGQWLFTAKILKAYMKSDGSLFDSLDVQKGYHSGCLGNVLNVISNRYDRSTSLFRVLSNISHAITNANGATIPFIEDAFTNKRKLNFINLYPLSYRLSAYREMYLIDDDFFNEVFGSYPEAMINAANNIQEILTTKDVEIWGKNNKISGTNLAEVIQINSNMITKGEWLQMADLPKADQARMIIQRVTNEQGVGFNAIWNIDDKESRMMTVFDCNIDSDALVNIYTIELFPGKLTRPVIRKHELFLDNKFDLTLKEIQ